MNEPQKRPFWFTSRMTDRERRFALIYLPIHIFILPLLAGYLVPDDSVRSSLIANLIYHGISLLLVMVFTMGFLRREFDTVCDRPLRLLTTVFIGYGLTLALDSLLGQLLEIFFRSAASFSLDNPNNSVIMDAYDSFKGPVTVITVLMAPILEEVLFRGGLFGTLMKKNRALAYIVTVAVFSLYHVWQSAIHDPRQLLYAVSYIGSSLVLCWAYERSNTIWAPIGLHMVSNLIALRALELLRAMP